MQSKLTALLFGILVMAAWSCKNKPASTVKPSPVYKGLYSFGPEIKSFKQCDNGHEFWVTDSSSQLEFKYSQLNKQQPDEPDEPVYIEVKGYKVKSPKDGLGSDYDSVLIVKKLVKITKDIPKGVCN